MSSTTQSCRCLTLTVLAMSALLIGPVMVGCEGRPRATGAGTGAVAGGAGGAAIGEAVSDEPGAGAAIGAAVGALGGYLAGDAVEAQEGRDYPENYHRHGNFGHAHPHVGPHTHEELEPRNDAIK